MTRRLFLIIFLMISWLSLVGCSNGYKKVDGRWCYTTWDEGRGQRIIPLGVDSKTFRILPDKKHAKDNHCVFWTEFPIKGADPETFELLPVDGYAKDRNRVFYEWRCIHGADPEKFQLLSKSGYAKDSNRVFLFDHEITGANPSEFKVIQFPYARDDSKVYCGTVPMRVDDIDMFKVLRAETRVITCYDKRYFVEGEEFDGLDISQEHPAVYGSGSAQCGTQYYDGPERIKK